MISKCFIVPLLLAAYIASGGANKYLLPVFALVFGWIGDVLLIKGKNKTNFLLGLTSFLTGHLFYIASFLYILGFFYFERLALKLDIASILVFIPVVFVLAMVVFRLVKPVKGLRLPVILYMTVLVVMNLIGFQVFLFNPGLAGLLILSGCFCFMISDTVLAYYTFRKIKISASVLIMYFYIIAQAKIIIGLLLL
jgi:uncharacterized membrane protein YhhN